MTDENTITAHEVVLTVPASVRYLRLVRMAVAAYATEQEWGLDDTEDLRTAVDELCALLLEGEDPDSTSHLHLRLGASAPGRTVLVEGWRQDPGGATGPDAIVAALLELLADEYRYEPDGEGRRFTLRRAPRG